MNPSGDGHKSTASSPAVFNRCTIIWMGDWSEHSYKEVGKSYLAKVDFETFASFEDSNIKNELALETAAGLTLNA